MPFTADDIIQAARRAHREVTGRDATDPELVRALADILAARERVTDKACENISTGYLRAGKPHLVLVPGKNDNPHDL